MGEKINEVERVRGTERVKEPVAMIPFEKVVIEKPGFAPTMAKRPVDMSRPMDTQRQTPNKYPKDPVGLAVEILIALIKKHDFDKPLTREGVGFLATFAIDGVKDIQEAFS